MSSDPYNVVPADSQFFSGRGFEENFYRRYNIGRTRGDVEELFDWIIQQDEAMMILDAFQFMPLIQHENHIPDHNVGEVFEGDEAAMIMDAFQFMPQYENPISTHSAISKYLKTRKSNEDDDGSEVCVICQDGLSCQEGEDDDTIGVLNCGHEYHVECIKKWLQVKNLCPLCKTTGISIG